MITESKREIDSVIKTWQKTAKYNSKRIAYQKSLRTKQKVDKIETERRKLIGEQEKIKRRIVEAERAQKKITEIRRKRNSLLSELGGNRSENFDERNRQANLITQRSLEKLKINVHKQLNNRKYIKNLAILKVKSYAESKELEAIVKKIPVIDFVEAVLQRNYKKLVRDAGLTIAKSERIINVLLQPENFSKTLALQYECFPEDQIEILYRKLNGSYHPLGELSMGQKADALLMIALGDSQIPVIIDQPEDALDLSSIWDDVCQRLRISKHQRQFIFTTHNSSVAVASDSDQFIVMEADADKGWISNTGSIDEYIIRKRVIDHLEGGDNSYNLKRKKYNLKE